MDEEKGKPATEVHHGAKGTARSIFAKLIFNGNVEERGIVPVPVEERTNKRTYLIVWTKYF